ncbi:MAG: hypothetical protein OXC80_10470 [Gammaproteobacteria bacterium]|nr:hypothetical protein [Gammaproteobacteria bacterium]
MGDSLEMNIVPVEFNEVPGYLRVLSTLKTSKLWLSEEHRSKIEKPSNPIFQPPEYESTNCCLECDWGSTCGQRCTTFFATSEATCLCGPVSYSPGGGGGGGFDCSTSNLSDREKAKSFLVETLESTTRGPREVFYIVQKPHPCEIGKFKTGPDYDVCPPSIKVDASSVLYAGHTHPKFAWPADRNKKVTCGLVLEGWIRSRSDVDIQNGRNEECSKKDNQTGNRYPLLLRTPNDIIKKCGSK